VWLGRGVTEVDAVIIVRALRQGQLANRQRPFQTGSRAGEARDLPEIDASTLFLITKALGDEAAATERGPYQYELSTNESTDCLSGRAFGVAIRDGVVELIWASVWVV
jgi:hypothetical protein